MNFLYSIKYQHIIYITKKRAKNRNQGEYLYCRWNNPIIHMNHPLLTHSTTKDAPSITPTLETLDTCSSLNTRSLHSTNITNDAIISITAIEIDPVNFVLAQFHLKEVMRQPPCFDIEYSRSYSTAYYYSCLENHSG